jgi:hypothetical protein
MAAMKMLPHESLGELCDQSWAQIVQKILLRNHFQTVY